MKEYAFSKNIIAELGERFREYRVDYPLTQAELADKSGVSTRSIARIENGEDLQLSTFIKLLSALDLENNLEYLLPDPRKRPSYYLNEEAKGKKKRRAKGKGSGESKKKNIWGDELL
ncbi:MAG: helix-turn-helix domain-containing protein [Anaerovoracaceae bacterium]